MGVNYTKSKLCQGHVSSPLEMGFSISAEILEMKIIIFKTILSVYKNKDILSKLGFSQKSKAGLTLENLLRWWTTMKDGGRSVLEGS